MDIDIYKNDRITVDGRFAGIEDIPIAIKIKTQNLDSIQKTKFFIKLFISDEAKMGVVKDVQNQLRTVGIEKVRHYTLKERGDWIH